MAGRWQASTAYRAWPLIGLFEETTIATTESRSHLLLNGPVGKTLLKLTVPMVVGNLSVYSLGIIDTYFIGLLGTKELAAVSYAFPVTLIVMSFMIGLNMSVATVVSKALGAKDRAEATNFIVHGLILSIVILSIVCCLGYVTIVPLFSLMGATETVLPDIKAYMQPWYAGALILAMVMIALSAMQASGNIAAAGTTMMIAAIVNIVLDPVLIFGLGPFPAYGVSGGAYATIIAWVVAFVISVWVVFFKEKLIDIDLLKWQNTLSHWRRLLYIGIPSTTSNMLLPLSSAVVLAIASPYGAPIVAAFGVGARLDQVALILATSMFNILPGFIGQNFGADQWSRIRHAVRFTLIFSLFFQALVWLALGFNGQFIGDLFSDNPIVINNIVNYIWIFGLSYGANGAATAILVSMTTVQKPMYSLLQSFIRLFVFLVPMAYFGSQLAGVTGIMWGMTIAMFCGLVSAIIGWQMMLKKMQIAA